MTRTGAKPSSAPFERRPTLKAWFVAPALVAILAGCGVGAEPTAGAPTAQPSSPAMTAAPTAGTAPPAGAPTELDGSYAVTWTAEELAQALGGDANPDAAQLAKSNSGTIRLSFDQGRYDMVYVDVNGDSCPGTFVVSGNRVVLTATTRPSEWECGDGLGETVVDAAWVLTDEGLSLTEWNLPQGPSLQWFAKALLGSKPLQRQP